MAMGGMTPRCRFCPQCTSYVQVRTWVATNCWRRDLLDSSKPNPQYTSMRLTLLFLINFSV